MNKENTLARVPGKDWLDEALQAHLSTPPEPGHHFDARCRAAALAALDVLRMARHRPALSNHPGALLPHLSGLAGLAGVSLKAVFDTLSVTSPDRPDNGTIRGLVRLAQGLGMALQEAMLRLRLQFAEAQGSSLLASVPARGDESTSVSLMSALDSAEASYDPAASAGLRMTLAEFQSAWQEETTPAG